MFGDRIRYGLRQRNAVATVTGGATTTVQIITGLEGAVAILLKYHSGSQATAPTGWTVSPCWDGAGVSPGNPYVVIGTQTLPLNAVETVAPSLTLYRGTSGLLIPIECDRAIVQVAVGAGADVLNAVFDAWPIYAQRGGTNRVGMPTPTSQ